MPYREERVAELFVAELREEVRLVLDWVFCCAEPHLAISHDVCGIMTRRDVIVVVSHLLLERAKLDESVAHHVGIGRQSFLDALDSIAHDLFPILFLKVSHLELQPILSSRSLRQLDVLLCRTRRILPVHTYFNIMQVGLQSSLAKQMHHDCAIHAARDENGNTALYRFKVHNS